MLPSRTSTADSETSGSRDVGPDSPWQVCHPWPSDQLLLTPETALKHAAVVVESGDEHLVVAVVNLCAAGLRKALETDAQRRVSIVAAGAGEIAEALAGPIIAERDALHAERLRALLTDLGLEHVLPERSFRALRDGDVRRALGALNGGWEPELRGLLEGLPHIAVLPREFDPALRLLLPPSHRASVELAPWNVQGDVLFLACTQFPGEGVVQSIARWTGYRVRCVLSERAVLSAAASQRPTREVTYRDRLRGIVASRPRVEMQQDRHLEAAARQMGVSVDQMRRRTLGESKGNRRPVLLKIENSAAGFVPLALQQSLGLLVTHVETDRVDIAVGNDIDDVESVKDLIAAVTNASVRVHNAAAADIEHTLAHLASGSHLAGRESRTGSPAQLSGPRPVSAVSATQLHSVQCGWPWIRLEHYSSTSEALQALPPNRMDIDAVPLRVDGSVLWVALAEPDDRILRELHKRTGLGIRPVLAEQSSIARRLALLRDRPEESSDRVRGHPVLEYLQAEGTVTLTELMAMLADPQVPVDTALDKADVLSFVDYAQIASRLGGIAQVDLRLQSYKERVVDALGQASIRQIWTDPLDPDVVRLLPPDVMERLAVLPVRRDEGTLLVAVADPFEFEVESLVASIGNEVVRIAVAPRPAVLSALRRAHGNTPLGDRLLARGIVSPGELGRALDLHRKSGVRLGQALLGLGMVTQEQLAFVVAEQRDLPFYRLQDMEHDPEVANLLTEEMERRLGVLPLYRVADHLVVATPDPLNDAALEQVAARTGLTVDPVVCTEHDLEWALEELYRDQYLHRSTSELVVRTPDESASRVLNRNQKIVFGVIGAVLAVLLVLNTAAVGVGLVASCSAFYVAFSLYRSYLIWRALSHDLEVPVSDEEVAALDDATLPIYTILVPLYKEASVLPTLLHGLSLLDYPATKLDVKILLEEDDLETRQAVDRMVLPAYVRPVVVPAAQPRCKPKACNYGLIHARGEYVVIYDAEDVPDPDQLKKVIVAFRKSGTDVACLQAKLNYYNGKQNLLTSWFTTEYSMWFDLFLPGLDAASVPIPLGGTSNHFPTARLLEAGAWDPYNVTEDADLGVRLYRRGWKTGIVDSTTLEEANSEVYNWIRQRSRWVKGYIQTYLVHMRHPIQLWRAVGTKAFFSFNMVVGGTFFGFLVNPIFWCLTALWYLTHAGMIRELYPGAVYYSGMFSLVVGNFAFVYLNVAGCLRRGYYGMVRHALLSPLYWALMSIAAWKGFLQLFTNPFYWEKTTHGLYQRSKHGDGGPK